MIIITSKKVIILSVNAFSYTNTWVHYRDKVNLISNEVLLQKKDFS